MTPVCALFSLRRGAAPKVHAAGQDTRATGGPTHAGGAPPAPTQSDRHTLAAFGRAFDETVHILAPMALFRPSARAARLVGPLRRSRLLPLPRHKFISSKLFRANGSLSAALSRSSPCPSVVQVADTSPIRRRRGSSGSSPTICHESCVVAGGAPHSLVSAARTQFACASLSTTMCSKTADFLC